MGKPRDGGWYRGLKSASPLFSKHALQQRHFNSFPVGTSQPFIPVALYPSKALFSLKPDNLHLHGFSPLAAMLYSSCFCPLDQQYDTLQMVQVDPFTPPPSHYTMSASPNFPEKCFFVMFITTVCLWPKKWPKEWPKNKSIYETTLSNSETIS